MFAKKIYKLVMADSQSFFSEGIMKSATDTITGEVSPPGYTGLLFRLFKCGPTGALNLKAVDCLCCWVKGSEVKQFYQPGATWVPSCVTLEYDHDRLIALKLAESFSI